MTNDPVADLLVRIKNAGLVKKKDVAIPHSKAKEAVLAVIKNGGYVEGFRVRENLGRKELLVSLRYNDRGKTVISGIRRVSSPSRHVYVTSRDIVKWVRGKNTLGIISTSRGVMSHRRAQEQRLGGELVGIIWS